MDLQTAVEWLHCKIRSNFPREYRLIGQWIFSTRSAENLLAFFALSDHASIYSVVTRFQRWELFFRCIDSGVIWTLLLVVSRTVSSSVRGVIRKRTFWALIVKAFDCTINVSGHSCFFAALPPQAAACSLPATFAAREEGHLGSERHTRLRREQSLGCCRLRGHFHRICDRCWWRR